MKRTWLLIGPLALCTAAGLHGQTASDSDTAKAFPSRTPRYVIQPSDTIEVLFRFTPEFNQVVTVQPDGFIVLQGAGETKVGGLTVSEATEAIKAKYKGILWEPEIALILKEFEKPFFIVGGEVAHPGRFDLRGDLTLTGAIAMAGGFNFGANESQVLLFRRISRDMVETKKINVKHTLERASLDEDVRLQPGDAIYVSKSRLGKVDQFMRVTRLGLYFNPFLR